MTAEQLRIIELEHQVAAQAHQIKELLEKISTLEKSLSYYQTKKNSRNSSLPPSKDLYPIQRTESLRKKTGRNPGGQAGRESSRLEMSDSPTKIVEHHPHYCSCCGCDLSDISSEFVGKRQVVDIPPIEPEITEHQVYGKRCNCGHVTESDYPAEANSQVCYGKNIQSLTAYFHSRQYLPFERMREMYLDVFGLDVSSGSLVNMVQKFAERASGIYELIRQRVAKSKVVGADETGNRINGKNAWAWVFQTPNATYIHSDESRGKAVIDKLFPQGFPKSMIVHDCWPSYFGVKSKGHQICTAHLLRELKYFDKLYPKQKWSKDFTTLLYNALELKKNMQPTDYLKPIKNRIDLEKQLEILLKQTINPKHKKLVVFKERILKYRNYLFAFLYHPEVPPDNNASERAVRTFKVKLKVSGLFRSHEGANAFAIIRSVIDTTIKNSKNVIQTLNLIPCYYG